MSTAGASVGSASNSSRVHETGSSTAPLSWNVHSSSTGLCGVAPTDSTGNSSTTCWSGGTGAASASRRWPRKPREIGDIVMRLSGRAGRLWRRNEDGGAIDGLGAVAVARAAVVAVVQREGRGSDERSRGDWDRQRVDACGDEYQTGAGRDHDAVDHRDHPGGGERQLPRAWCFVNRRRECSAEGNEIRLELR